MVVMGRVAAPFGVQGWIRAQVYTQSAQSLVEQCAWWLQRDGDWQRQEIEQAAVHGKSVIAKLAGCDDRELAAGFKGMDIAVPRESLPASAENEFYWIDLLGLKVSNLQGEELGTVERLLETGANPVLAVRGECERLIPFVDEIVHQVDIAGGSLLVDWGRDF